MAKIALRAYNREIETLVERGQIEEAIAHSKYILRFFPKHVETYRLLGKAYIESQRYSEAADILQRILSVLPDDFVSQIGMSIIREDEGNLDAAIFHMERAHEIQPSNVAVQDELRRLYGRRDGVEPPRLRLTRGALVRLYAKGDLHRQAIAEIRAALAEDPNRYDLEVILSRMYFLLGQKVEATDVASRLVSKLPYCLEANRVLADVLPSTSRADDAKIYQQRVYALDPYLAYLTPNAPTLNLVPDNAVTLDRLDWQPSIAGEAQPAWAQDVGITLGDEKEAEAGPDWLATPAGTEAEGEAEQMPEQTSLAGPASSQTKGETTEQIPDWMQAAGWVESGAGAETLAGAETEGEGEAAPAELPDWVKQMAPQPDDSSLNYREDAKLDWLDDILPPAEAQKTEIESEAPAAEMEMPQAASEAEPETSVPDWLAEMTAGAAAAEAAPEKLVEPEMPMSKAPEAVQASSEELPAEFAAPLEAAGETAAGAIEYTPEAEVPPAAEILEPESPVSAVEPTATVQDETPVPGFHAEELVADVVPETPPSEITAEMPEVPPVQGISEIPAAGQEQPAAEIETPLAGVEAPAVELPAEPIAESVEAPAVELPAEPLAESVEAPAVELPAKPLTEGVEAPAVELPAEPLAESVEAPVSEIPGEQKAAELEEPAAELAGEPAAEIQTPTAALEEPTAPAQVEPAVQAATAQPEMEDLDAAMAWLESLAAKQGADQETLSTPLDQRTETPPEWVSKELEESKAEVPPQAAPIEELPTAPAAVMSTEEVPAEQPTPAEGVAPEIQAEPTLPETLEPQAQEASETGLEGQAPPAAGTTADQILARFAEMDSETTQSIPQEAFNDTSLYPFKDFSSLKPVEPSQGSDLTPPQGLETVIDDQYTRAEKKTSPLGQPEQPTSQEEMDADAAFAWLESLAAQQGADEGTLTTPPEDRQAAAPSWVLEQTNEPTELTDASDLLQGSMTIEGPAAPTPEDQAPAVPEISQEWATPSEPTAAATPEEPGEMVLPTEPVEWIAETTEGEVAPETPVTEQPAQPAGEPASTAEEPLPAWLQEFDQNPAPAQAEVKPAAEEELPEWLKGFEAPAEASLTQASDESISISTWLKDQEVPEAEAPVSTHAEIEDTQPVKVSTPVQPAAGLETEPAQAQTPVPEVAEKTAGAPAAAAENPLLAQAQTDMLNGNINQALSGYSQLIEQGQYLDEIVHDLRDSLYRYPVEIAIWQTLGDAYIRSNHIQEALDAYTKAEELLK